VTVKIIGGFSLPAPPDHAQVGIIRFMGHKPHPSLRVKILKTEAAGGGRQGLSQKGRKYAMILITRPPKYFSSVSPKPDSGAAIPVP